MTRKEKLLSAAQTLTEVLTTLDRELLPTCVCGCTPRRNHWEFQRAIELEAIVTKLQRWAQPKSADFQEPGQIPGSTIVSGENQEA